MRQHNLGLSPKNMDIDIATGIGPMCDEPKEPAEDPMDTANEALAASGELPPEDQSDGRAMPLEDFALPKVQGAAENPDMNAPSSEPIDGQPSTEPPCGPWQVLSAGRSSMPDHIHA